MGPEYSTETTCKEKAKTISIIYDDVFQREEENNNQELYNLKKDPMEKNNLVRNSVNLWLNIYFVFLVKRITQEKYNIKAEVEVDRTLQDRDGYSRLSQPITRE